MRLWVICERDRILIQEDRAQGTTKDQNYNNKKRFQEWGIKYEEREIKEDKNELEALKFD